MSIRRALLLNLDSVEVSPELTFPLNTVLALFTNEYVYFETNEETELVSMLEAKIAENIAQASQVATTEVLCLATFDHCINTIGVNNYKYLISYQIKRRG